MHECEQMNTTTCPKDVIGVFSHVWESFLMSSLGQWDMLEAYVAGLCFTIFIIFFRLLDQFPTMNKHRLRPETKTIRLFLPDPNNSWRPLIMYILAIHIFHYFYPKPLPDVTIPSACRVGVELALGILAYDFLFFWLHYSMHVFPTLSFVNHKVHHTQVTLCSSEVQHHSFIDGIFQVLVNILVQKIHTPFGAKHYLSRILHNVVITYMLAEIHGEHTAY